MRILRSHSGEYNAKMSVRPGSRQKAAVLLNDQERIVADAMDATRRVMLKIIALAGKVWGQGMNPADVLAGRFTEGVEDVMIDALFTAHITGRIRMLTSAAEQGAWKVAAFASARVEAAQFVEERAAMLPEQAEAIRTAYSNEAVNVTRSANAAVEAKVRAAADGAIREGVHVREGTRRIGEAFAQAGVAPQNPYLYETIYRTQTNLAYSAGRWEAAQDPAIDEILWGYEYVTVGDDRVRAEHAALEGTILPKDDPRWGSITPPNGWSCRCQLIDVYNDEAPAAKPPPDEVDVDGELVKPGPDEGWNFHPATVTSGPPEFGVPAAAGAT